MAWKATKLGLKVTAFSGLVMLWNATMFPDEEEELDRMRRGNMHLILGRRSDGSILYLPLSGAFADALGWFGASDLKEDVKDVLSGAATVYDKLKL